MNKRRLILLTLLVASCTCVTSWSNADEGMWLFNFPPTLRVQKKYGFIITPAWLQHLQLSSLRLPGGSGAFVSSEGLFITNHHVGAGCIQQVSSERHNYIETGFYAKNRSEEVRCPNLFADVLLTIEDVTERVHEAATPDMTASDLNQAQQNAESTIEHECERPPQFHCQVVSLYSGALYNLYQYERFTDVRLVFAPEFGAVFFGGDFDNFEYPRYDLDIAFFRAYRDGQPAHGTRFLAWSDIGTKDRELVFVSGNPSSTGRLNTLTQLALLRDVTYPVALESLSRRDEALRTFSKTSDENARTAHQDLLITENSLKAIKGYMSGLRDQRLMSAKSRSERAVRQTIESNPQLKRQFGDPWNEISSAIEIEKQIYLPLNYLERLAGFQGDLANYARTLVRLGKELPKPEAERLREYRGSALASRERDLLSNIPINHAREVALLTESLLDMKQQMPFNPVVDRIFHGLSAEMLAADLIEKTRLDDAGFRKQLYEGGQAAVMSTNDPLITLMRDIDPEARAVRANYETQVDAIIRRDAETISKIHFALEGTDTYPDATGTLRLSYGLVHGYTEDGQGVARRGAHLPYFTTIGGAYEHEVEHGNADPYRLPPTWTSARTVVNLKVPLNVVQTSDIVGGNSGSPVVNRAGEFVGIIFDTNSQSMAHNFSYDESKGRSIHVDSRGILETLKNIYHADALAIELTKQ